MFEGFTSQTRHPLGQPAALPERLIEADRAPGNRLKMPQAVLWGEHGTVGRCFDLLALRRTAAHDVRGQALPCVHCIAEEAPQALLDHALPFFMETTA